MKMLSEKLGMMGLDAAVLRLLELMINQLPAASFWLLLWTTLDGRVWFGLDGCCCIEFCRIVSNVYGAARGAGSMEGCNTPVG